MQRKLNLTWVICLRMGKTTEAKPYWENLTSPLSRIHYYQNMRLQLKESQYLIPTHSWTLTLMHNWICNVVTISPFNAWLHSFQCMALSTWLTNRCTDPSMWLTHKLEKDVGCKVLQFIHTMKIKKLLGHKTLRRTNTAASSRERWTRADCLWSQHACNNKCNNLFI